MIDSDVARLTADIADRGTVISRMAPAAAAPPADAFFVVADPSGRRSFTREGDFAVHDGLLTTNAGAPVLGYAEGATTLGELRLDPVDVALERARAIGVDREGRFGYTHDVVDPRTGRSRAERVVAGTVALARFPAATRMVAFGAGERAPLGVQAHFGRPSDGNFGALASGVDARAFDRRLDRELDRLHDAYQQLDALTAAKFARSNGDKTAMDLVK